MNADKFKLIYLCLSAFICVLISSPLFAQIELPLQGYYRPGWCMPVLVGQHDSVLTLQSDGAVPAEVASGRTGVVPMLMLTTSATALSGKPLHPLEVTQRLVGTVDANDSIAAQIFPDDQIVTVQLDPANPLPGSAMNWQTLDAAILNSPPEEKQIADLLANGIVIAVRSPRKPVSNWPWQKIDGGWILRHDPAGPVGTNSEAAYLPTQAWRASKSASFRKFIVLAAVLIVLIVLATLLIRGRRALVLMAAVVILCCIVLEIWRRSQSSIAAAEGSILVLKDGIAQQDHWLYLSGNGENSQSTRPADDRPILFDPSQARQINLRLQCDADGLDAWRFDLPDKMKLAFVSRTMRLQDRPPEVEKTSVSPLFELARQSYLEKGTQIVGEIKPQDDAQEIWPTVVIENIMQR